MGHQTISAPRFNIGRRRAARVARHTRRLLWISVGLSVVGHLVAALTVILLPRVLPHEAPPQAEGTVELLMVEQKGAEPSPGSRPKHTTPAPQPKADSPKAEDRTDDANRTPAPPALAQGDEPAPPIAQASPGEAGSNDQPAEKKAETNPAPPRSEEAPVFDLGGTDSESNAIVLGEQVLPALKDDRFRNRPPVYPDEAAVRGEHGTVVVVIHVSENGFATGVDVLDSSGYDVLDQAAVNAVLKWHFRPAMKEGRSIPFDMPFRFVFE